MQPKRFWLAAALTGILISIPAVSLLAGSLFSRNGIGLPLYYAGSHSIGMGGIGIAAVSPLSPAYLNPAAVSLTGMTRFDASYVFENADVTVAASEAGSFENAFFNSFQIILPIKAETIGLGIGLQPYSVASYQASASAEVNGQPATQTLTGSGGLQRGFLQLGVRPTKWLAVGAGANIYWGRVNRTWRFVYSSTSFAPTVDEISNHMSGLGAFAGVLININDKVSLGAIAHAPTTLDTETRKRYFFVRPTDVTDSETKLPFSHGYGVAFTPNPRFTLSGELFMQSWGSIDAKEMFSAATTNSMRAAAGIAFTPSTDVFAGFFSRMTYRLGGALYTLPYLSSNGEEVKEQLFSFGIGVPFNRQVGKLDMGLEFGKRGSLSDNGTEESLVRFTLALTGGERWFMTRSR